MGECHCGAIEPRYRQPMTHERLSSAVLMVGLVVVAAAWLWFLLAFANLIFGH